MHRLLLTVMTLLAVGAAACGGAPAASDTDSQQDGRPGGAGTFEPSGRMMEARQFHAAAFLDDGRVLLAGGLAKGAVEQRYRPRLSSAELFDPVAGEWKLTGEMDAQREFLTLTRLADGRVLAAGGANNQQEPTNSAEIYDPAVGTWSSAGKMSKRRWKHVAVLLADGRVLVVGGRNRLLSLVAEADTYDPATGEWSPAGEMSEPRALHTVTALRDGRVLVVGGGKDDGPYLASAEIYDPRDLFLVGCLVDDVRQSLTHRLAAERRQCPRGGRPGQAGICRDLRSIDRRLVPGRRDQRGPRRSHGYYPAERQCAGDRRDWGAGPERGLRRIDGYVGGGSIDDRIAQPTHCDAARRREGSDHRWTGRG